MSPRSPILSTAGSSRCTARPGSSPRRRPSPASRRSSASIMTQCWAIWATVPAKSSTYANAASFDSTVDEGQQVLGQAIVVGDDEAMRSLLVHLQRAARYELGRLLRRLVQRIDLVLVAMNDQRRHRDGTHVGAQVAARDGAH